MDTIGNGTNINVAASGQSGLTMQSASNSTRTRGLYVMNGFVIALLLVLIVIQLLGLKASVEERKKDKDVQNETATTLVTSTEFKSSFSTIEQEIQALDGKLKMTMEGLDDLKKGFEAMQKYSVEMKEVVQGIKAAHEGNIQEAENQNTTLSQIADDITRIKKLYLKQNDKLNNLSDNVERMSTKINDLKNDVSPSNPLKPMSEPVNSSIEKSGNDNMGFGGEIDDEKKSNEKKGDEKKIDKEKFKDLERAFKSLSDSIDNASRYQELKSYRVKVQEAISEFKASGKSTSLDAAISELSRIIENKRAYEALIKKCDALKQEIITVKTNVSSQAVEAK